MKPALHVALLVLALAGCNDGIPEENILTMLNEREILVEHVGHVRQAEVISSAKSGDCEVRLVHVTGSKGRTYVSMMRRTSAESVDSALTFSDNREGANAQLGSMLSQHCNT